MAQRNEYISIELEIRGAILAIMTNIAQLKDNKELSSASLLELIYLEDKVKFLADLITDPSIKINERVFNNRKNKGKISTFID